MIKEHGWFETTLIGALYFVAIWLFVLDRLDIRDIRTTIPDPRFIGYVAPAVVGACYLLGNVATKVISTLVTFAPEKLKRLVRGERIFVVGSGPKVHVTLLNRGSTELIRMIHANRHVLALFRSVLVVTPILTLSFSWWARKNQLVTMIPIVITGAVVLSTVLYIAHRRQHRTYYLLLAEAATELGITEQPDNGAQTVLW